MYGAFAVGAKQPDLSDHFSAILDGMYHAVVSTDLDGRILMFNAGAEHCFGLSRRDVIGRDVGILIPHRYREAHKQHFNAFLSDVSRARLMGSRNEIVCLRADGEEFPAEASILRTILDDHILCTAIIRDLSDRKKWERELQVALDRAEEANRVKTHLLANLSHELRTPLNAIIGFSEAMLAGVGGQVDNERHRSYLGDIHMSGQHLLNLVNDLLDLSTIEAGAQVFEMTAIDVAEVFENTKTLVTGVKPDMPTISMDLPPGRLAVEADISSLRQVLVNLVKNAIRHTDAAGVVTLAARPDEAGTVRIDVADTGTGIAPDELDHIFEPFYRGEDARKSDGQGVGVGLAIVRMLVARMNGAVSVHSVPGAGSCFSIRLRRAVPDESQGKGERQPSLQLC